MVRACAEFDAMPRRYGAAKNEADSDDEEKPVYEPMTMRDMV